MSNDTVTIFAEDINTQQIVADIKQTVAEKRDSGFYDTYDLSEISTLKIEELQDEEEFLRHYLKVVQHSWDINIGTYPIPSKGGLLGKPVVFFKKCIWHLLKFYTYRLFSQQKDYNSQVANILYSLNAKLDRQTKITNERFDAIEERIKKLSS